MKTAPIIALLLMLFGWTISSSPLMAQDSVSHTPAVIRINAHYGFLIPHSDGMEGLVEKHVTSLEVHYERANNGSKNWHHLFNFPTWGITFTHSQLSSKEKLGTGTGIYPYFGFPLLKRERFKLTYRLGAGIGYISKPFDREENFKNIAIGSYLNIVGSMSTMMEWKVSQSISLNSGVAFTHFSNGAFSKPNLGINIPTVFAGLALGGFGDHKRPQKGPTLDYQNYAFQVVGTAGLKQTGPGGSNRYFTSTTSVEIQRVFWAKHALTTGIDIMYNTALKEQREQFGDTISNNLQLIQPGVKLLYHLMFGHFELFGGGGIYIANQFEDDLPFYNRVGLRYFLKENIMLNSSLKTHLFRADYLEMGIGYRFLKLGKQKQTAR